MGSMLGQSTGGIHGQKDAVTTANNQQSFTTFRPEDVANIQQAQQGLLQQTAAQQGLNAQLQRQAAQQGAPQLNSQYNQFAQAPQGLDALGRQQVSLGTQQLQSAAAAQARGFQRQLGGTNPAAAQILSRQAGMQARLQANPLLAQAGQGSFDRNMQFGQAQQNSQQLSNQALAQQAQLGAANRQEQAGYGQAGLQSQQALLPMFSQLAQQFGTQNTTGVQDQNSLKGGVKQNAFNK